MFRCHKAKTADHNIHFKKKVFQCDKCDNNFKSEHFLEIHKRKEHGEGSATVMCSHCAKEFPTERVNDRLLRNNLWLKLKFFL